MTNFVRYKIASLTLSFLAGWVPIFLVWFRIVELHSCCTHRLLPTLVPFRDSQPRDACTAT